MKNYTESYLFVRDDDTEITIEFSRNPYDPGCTYGPPEHCYPPEGGDVEEYYAPENLTDAEDERLLDELNALPPPEFDDYDDRD